MRADHHASSSTGHVEHGLRTPARDSVPDRIWALVDDVLRAAGARARNGNPRETVIADRDPMGELCAAARAHDVQAETLILALKDSWRRLPESHGPNRLDSEVMLATVITRCIREYYGPRRA
jgi:hypothetical protein